MHFARPGKFEPVILAERSADSNGSAASSGLSLAEMAGATPKRWRAAMVSLALVVRASAAESVTESALE